jgi:L-alanine-DL-glutamate epimerase-like enolase superfamily enzyme
MRIDSLLAIPVRVPRAKPMVAAGTSTPLAFSDFGVVRVSDSERREGIGEISMNLGRTGAIQCDDVNRIIAPALIGREAGDIQGALHLMDLALDGSEPAKAGVEMALFDLLGKQLGVPLYQLLGGRVRTSVPVRWGLGFGDPTAGVAELAHWIERGFRAIKIKIGRPGTGLDLEMVRAVRDAWGEQITIMVDANSAYSTPLAALQELRRLEPFDLQLIEQPLGRRQLEGLALLRRRLETPILVDESMRHFSDAYAVARAGAADVLSVYVCEAGGLLPALKACAIGESAGLPCTLGSQCELGIGTAAMAHLAVCVPNLAYESDITGHLRYEADVICERLDYSDGAISPPDLPGLGVTLDEDMLERWRTDR